MNCRTAACSLLTPPKYWKLTGLLPQSVWWTGHWTISWPGKSLSIFLIFRARPARTGLPSTARPGEATTTDQGKQQPELRWEYFLSDSLTSHVSVLPSRLIINLLGISQLSTRQNIKATARIIGNGKELFYSALWKTAAAVDVAVST